MRSPFFSIIIPTYNSANIIAECLDSIVAQSFGDVEIIVVDGASADNTISIVKDYAARFENIQWVSEKDEGIYDAMNKGALQSKGDWILFLGSDDRLYNWKVLENMLPATEKGYDVLYGNAKIIGDAGWAKDGDIFNGEYDLNKLLTKNICQQAIFYSKACLQNRLPIFKKDYKICADWDFNLYCWSKHPFLYVDMIIVNFFGGGISGSKIRDDAFRKDMSQNLILYFGSDLLLLNNEHPKNKISLKQPLIRFSRNWIKKLFSFNKAAQKPDWMN